MVDLINLSQPWKRCGRTQWMYTVNIPKSPSVVASGPLDNDGICWHLNSLNMSELILPSKRLVALGNFQGGRCGSLYTYLFWLAVSTHLKNTSQSGSSPQVGVKIKNIWKHHLVLYTPLSLLTWLTGKSPCSMGNTSSNGGLSIVMTC